MGRSLRRTARIGALAIACLAPIGCRGAPVRRDREVEFPPGRHVVRQQEVRVELIAATWDQTGLAVFLEIDNRGATPVAVERRGIVLGHQSLEFPVSSATDPPLAAQTVVPPHGKTRLRARFDTGARVTEVSTLRLRAVRRDGDWIENLALSVPAGIDPDPDPQPATP